MIILVVVILVLLWTVQSATATSTSTLKSAPLSHAIWSTQQNIYFKIFNKWVANLKNKKKKIVQWKIKEWSEMIMILDLHHQQASAAAAAAAWEKNYKLIWPK